jgi:hypothetical protein
MFPSATSGFSFPTVATLLLASLLSSPSLPAQSLPPLSGVSVSLATSTNRIDATPEALLNPRRTSLAAQIQLRNRSRVPLTYSFPDLSAARAKFQFSLYNEQDEVVWTSPGRIPARSIAPTSPNLTLRPGSAWTASALIPLAPSGAWLPTGTYRLEAVLAGTPSVFAATSFEITAPPPIVVDRPINTPTLVGGLDQLSAQLVTNERGSQSLRVTASGWVPHPGYTNPRLEPSTSIPLVISTDGSTTLYLDFNVDTPAPNAFYIQVITNVTATFDVPFTGQSSVNIRSASGSKSVPITDAPLPPVSRFPAHWGPPPAIQTMDYGELPGGYGMGSSTLANWIRQNMEADAANTNR